MRWNSTRAFAASASASSVSGFTRSTLLRISIFGCGAVATLSSSASASPLMPRSASISTRTISASLAPPQAVVTIAVSSRRRGLKMPGVSTKTICALSCVAMPRTIARVVCTLCVTIDTFAPTSWFTSVDLPAFGAPIRATKPEWVLGLSVGHHTGDLLCGPHAFPHQEGSGCRLLGLAPRTAASRGRLRSPPPARDTVKTGWWSGPSRLSMT